MRWEGVGAACRHKAGCERRQHAAHASKDMTAARRLLDDEADLVRSWVRLGIAPTEMIVLPDFSNPETASLTDSSLRYARGGSDCPKRRNES